MREEAYDWLESSIVDLEEAKEAYRRGSYHLTLFLAHQAVEKALKAYMIGFKKKRPPKTHDLVELLEITRLQLETTDVDSLSELSPYYIISRYPNTGLRKPWKEIAQGTAQRLLATSEKVVSMIKTIFERRTYSPPE